MVRARLGFDYRGVRAHGGLAWFPLLDEAGGLRWLHNDAYAPSPFVCKAPQGYPQLGIEPGVPIYTQFAEDPDRFLFVSHPQQKEEGLEELPPLKGACGRAGPWRPALPAFFYANFPLCAY